MDGVWCKTCEWQVEKFQQEESLNTDFYKILMGDEEQLNEFEHLFPRIGETIYVVQP